VPSTALLSVTVSEYGWLLYTKGVIRRRVCAVVLTLMVSMAISSAKAQTPPAFPSPPCQEFGSPSANRPGAQLGGHILQSEWNLGKRLAEEAERHTTLVTDPTTIQYLNRIEQNLVTKAGLKGCFTVQIVRDVSPNAYSLPGGFLYITTRLILMANSEAELAAALAHETAHVRARHFTKLGQRRRLWGGLILAGGPAGYIARRYAGPLVTLKLLRNFEFEADRLGLQYLSAAGYEPSAMSGLLQTSFQDDNPPTRLVDRLFESHPPTSTRINRLRQIASQSQFGQNGAEQRDEFRNIQMRISLLSGVPLPGDNDQPPVPEEQPIPGITTSAGAFASGGGGSDDLPYRQSSEDAPCVEQKRITPIPLKRNEDDQDSRNRFAVDDIIPVVRIGAAGRDFGGSEYRNSTGDGSRNPVAETGHSVRTKTGRCHQYGTHRL